MAPGDSLLARRLHMGAFRALACGVVRSASNARGGHRGGEDEMAEIRRVKQVWKSKPTIEGAGAHLRRAFGFSEAPQFDPFLLLDDFRSSQSAEYQRGFPRHRVTRFRCPAQRAH